MRIGRLRHRVTIERYTTTQNEFGEEVESYTDLATRWAAVEPLQGREYWDAQQTTAEISLRIRMRHDDTAAGITPRDRIAYNSRTFEIVSPPIIVNERKREVHLMCREIAP